MKRSSSIASVLAVILLAALCLFPASNAEAQGYSENPAKYNPDGNGIVYRYTAVVDSLNNYTSNAFSISSYDAESFSTYPIAFGYKVSSVAAVPNVFIYIQGTYGDGNWFAVDTVAANDSAETYTTGTLDLNGKKCASYRVVLDGQTGNEEDTIVTLSLYAYRKDPDLISR